ncbi:hypothetical protein JHK85_035852 [Glycine max]|nr:hypothetical protein JHK85_035852 [Glycine max]
MGHLIKGTSKIDVYVNLKPEMDTSSSGFSDTDLGQQSTITQCLLKHLRIIQAFEKYNVEKDVAEQIKKEFDKRHEPTWHCIVGRNFAKKTEITGS